MTCEEQALLAVVKQAPAELVHAWRHPHVMIGWYNTFGQAVEAYLKAEGVTPQSHGGGYAPIQTVTVKRG